MGRFLLIGKSKVMSLGGKHPPPHGISRTQAILSHPPMAPPSPRILSCHVWLRLQISTCEKGKVTVEEAHLLALSDARLNSGPLDTFQGG